MIAPACDGEDVGEAWIAFQWASQLSERFELTLVTTYKRGHTPPSRQLAGVRVIEWEEPAGVGRYERLNSLLQPGYVPFYIRARRWIRERLAAGEWFDIAHQVVPVAMRYPSPAANLGIPLILGPVGGSLESPPAFVSEEGSTPWWQRLRRFDGWRVKHDPLLRRTYESAACIIGVAPYVRHFLSPIRIRRFEVMSDIAVREVHDRVNRTSTDRVVRLLFVGRVIRTKGLRDVIRALALLTELPVILDVVGEGSDRRTCEELAEDIGVDARVTFHGRVSREAVDRFYESADIFVFPSYREPGGSVILEAMAFGLPLIVSSRGGPDANVTNACAIRLDAKSPAQLSVDCAAAISALVNDQELRQRMGNAAREHARATHLWSGRVERMATLYDDLAVADGRGGTAGLPMGNSEEIGEQCH